MGYNSKKELYKDTKMKTRKKLYGNYNIVGRKIEELRKAKGLKQKDFIISMPKNFIKHTKHVRNKLKGSFIYGGKCSGNGNPYGYTES